MISMSKLSRTEKMDLAEALWDSAHKPQDNIQITPEQQHELTQLLSRFALENKTGNSYEIIRAN